MRIQQMFILEIDSYVEYKEVIATSFDVDKLKQKWVDYVKTQKKECFVDMENEEWQVFRDKSQRFELNENYTGWICPVEFLE